MGRPLVPLGFTPKEHKEHEMEEKRLKWQAEREDADGAWRKSESSENRKWRIIELLVVGGLATVLIVAATIVGASYHSVVVNSHD